MRILRVVAFLFLSSLAIAQNTATITAHLADPGSTSVSSRTFVRAELKNTGGQQCRIGGVALVTPYLKDFTPNATGDLSFSIYKTSVITCGSSTGNAQWSFSIWRDGKPAPSCFLQVSSDTNLNSASCLNATATPVTVTPTDAIYARVDGSNAGFTGAISAPSASISGAVSAGSVNGVINSSLQTGANAQARLNAAITTCGVNPCVIEVPSTETDGCASSIIPNNVTILDYRGLNVTTPCGANTIAYITRTAGVLSQMRRSWQIFNPDRSMELSTDVATFTGAMPAGNNSVEGPTMTGQSFGAITVPGTTNILGSESVGQLNSTGGTFNYLIGHQGSCVTIAASTTNATTCAGIRGLGLQKNGTGTITNNYALEGTQTTGGTNNYALHAGGSILQDNAVNYDVLDHTGAIQHFLQTDASDNTFISGLSATGFIRILSKATGGTTWVNAIPGSSLWQFDPNSAGINVEFGTVAQVNTSSGNWTIAAGQNTVGSGIPAIWAKVDLTAQGAAIGATNLIASTAAAGMYEISYVATITQAATTSSILGGSVGFRLQYTDNDTSVVKLTNQSPVVSSSVNGTSTQISGVMIANCKITTALQYAFDYTSVGATPMQYNLHIKVKYLGN